MNTHVIEICDLTVTLGDVKAVHGVSFTVDRGRIHAVLGRYGAGKTTLLEAVAGYRRPSGGTVRVAGADPYEQRDSARLGTVWKEGGLFPGLTVTEVVETWRRWTLDPLTAEEALGLTGLAERAETRFEHLTLGEQRRLDLALALLGRSEILFLDEPSVGLDRATTEELWATLRSLAGQGVTILLTTTHPVEARNADRACALSHGRLVGASRVRHHAA